MSGLSGMFSDTWANFQAAVTTRRGSPGSDSKVAPRVGYSLNASGNVDQIAFWCEGWWVYTLTNPQAPATVLGVYPTAQVVDREAFSHGWVPATA